ncbi:MAG: hypothetical protein IH999_08535 [Proteobacteria bacterium]|nr:hypothetical protein [Pseudomonadota bacterium]
MTTLAFVDSLPALARVQEKFPDAQPVTDNPLLAADPRAGRAIINIDRLVTQPDAFALGRVALELAAGVDRRLEAAPVAERFGCVPGHLRLAGATSRLLASFLYRGALMTRAIAAHQPRALILAVVDAPRWDEAQPLMLPRFACPYRQFAAHGFFAELPVTVETVATDLPTVVNDTSIRDYGRRVALLPLPVLLHEVVKRLGCVGRPGGRYLVIGAENEALRECLPWLLLRGYRLRRVGKIEVGTRLPALGFDEPGPLDPELADLLEPWLCGEIGKLPDFDAVRATALARTVLVHLTAGLRHLGQQVPELRRRLESAFAGINDGRVFLTGGLFGPVGAQIYGLCRSLGVTVVDFEHGVTTGLAALAQRKIGWSEAASTDLLLTCSERAARAFERVGRDSELAIHVIGLPDQVRSLIRRRWQRRLARRRLGAPGRRGLVMHVSTLLYSGNMRSGLGAPGESVVFDLDRRLITEVYARLSHKVVFKQYPTQRFPHEPGYCEVVSVPPGVSFVKDEDFRYIRAAADVIVTLTPTSTLGWCLGTGVPVVWLDSKIMNPLIDGELREEFRRSFLFVDLDVEDWVGRLRALLDRDLAAIRSDWDARAQHRARLLTSAITGPRGSAGKRAARLVSGLIGREAAAPLPQDSLVIKS